MIQILKLLLGIQVALLCTTLAIGAPCGESCLPKMEAQIITLGRSAAQRAIAASRQLERKSRDERTVTDFRMSAVQILAAADETGQLRNQSKNEEIRSLYSALELYFREAAHFYNRAADIRESEAKSASAAAKGLISSIVAWSPTPILSALPASYAEKKDKEQFLKDAERLNSATAALDRAASRFTAMTGIRF
jgi:hypothetical protein